jgi:hypothetical protein
MARQKARFFGGERRRPHHRHVAVAQDQLHAAVG